MKRIRMSKISIKWQMFVYLSLFSAVMILLLWLFQVVFLQSFYKAIKIYNIKATAARIAENIDSAGLQTILSSQARNGESDITITDLNGNVLYSFKSNPTNTIQLLTTDDYKYMVAQAQKNSGTYSEWLDQNGLRKIPDQKPDDTRNSMSPSPAPPPRQQNKGISYTKIVKQKSGAKVAVIINADISPVDATVLTIRTQLVCVTFIMLVFALLLAFLVSKKVSKPIVRINDSAKGLARGSYENSFDVKGYREISELGDTLNYAAKELGKTEQLRRDLIANISHDLRTPLTMITGYAEVMRDLPGENTPANVQVIIDETNRLTTLVNDVLDISKLESSAEEMKFEAFNLTESIQNILLRYKKLTEQGGYTIRFLHDSDAFIRGDELRISQVVYNLVNNAINYTGKDKMVLVRQMTDADHVRIEIIDTGEGIPQEKLPMIWDRYYKVDKSHTRATVGTGLGLSIVKTILEKHGASYGVQSTPGQGSVFWFEFQRLAAAG